MAKVKVEVEAPITVAGLRAVLAGLPDDAAVHVVVKTGAGYYDNDTYGLRVSFDPTVKKAE